MQRDFLVTVFLLALAAGAGAVEPAAESLEAQLRVEERLLERARERYREARALEQQVLRDLQSSSRSQDARLDSALAELLAEDTPAPDEAGSMSRLRSSERELAGTRETALTLARENSDTRREPLARAALMRELRLELERLGRQAIVDATGLDGRWQVELEGLDTRGVFEFDSEGTLVTGSYRLDDGSQGSIRGTLVSDRLRLDRIDWAEGLATRLSGNLNASAGTIEGTWTAVDVSGGAPGSGTWRAVRLERR